VHILLQQMLQAEFKVIEVIAYHLVEEVFQHILYVEEPLLPLNSTAHMDHGGTPCLPQLFRRIRHPPLN
jgi:hypothetical protein